MPPGCDADVIRNASEEARRELRQLNGNHDRKIAKLEEELYRKLDKTEVGFERVAAKEDRPEKVREKGDKLQEKVDESDAKFDEKIQEDARTTKSDERFYTGSGVADCLILWHS